MSSKNGTRRSSRRQAGGPAKGRTARQTPPAVTAEQIFGMTAGQSLVPVVFSTGPGTPRIPPILTRVQDVPAIVEALTPGNAAAAALFADQIRGGDLPLLDDDWEILKALYEHHSRPLLQVELETITASSRRTIGRRLKVLRGLGLTRRCGGERQGEELTPLGLRLAAIRFAH
jgi:hypothetical protein